MSNTFKIKRPLFSEDGFRITTHHNQRANWYRSGRHQGLDISTRTAKRPSGFGTPIRAVADGIWNKPTYTKYKGITVTLTHKNGFRSTYSHLQDHHWVSGYKEIPAGDIIGLSGNSGKPPSILGIKHYGAHLHFEILDDRGFSVDPMKFIEAGDKFLTFARARALMLVEGKGEIMLLSRDKLISINQHNAWSVLKENTWGIDESSYNELQSLINN